MLMFMEIKKTKKKIKVNLNKYYNFICYKFNELFY